jgi:hypothetical protein
MRLAPEETSVELTGYGDHGVTCIGMKTDIPVKINLWIKIGILILIICIYNNISHQSLTRHVLKPNDLVIFLSH